MPTPTNKTIALQTTIPTALDGCRLDKALASLYPDYSRARLQCWIKAGEVTVNHQVLRPRDRIHQGDSIRIQASLPRQHHDDPEAIPLNVIDEDDSLLVIDKPAGLVVHPGAGNHKHTLLNALLYYDPALAHLPRAGIVHRLDKDTSGLMVIARTLEAHNYLVHQLRQHRVRRVYEAIVYGELISGGTIDQPIGRHRSNRKKMAPTPYGRPAVSHYRILTRFNAYTHIQVILETGRTHQIRVHMASIQYPLVGDPLYPGRRRVVNTGPPRLRDYIQHFNRQALHARRLELYHPSHQRKVYWESPLADDLAQLRRLLVNNG